MSHYTFFFESSPKKSESCGFYGGGFEEVRMRKPKEPAIESSLSVEHITSKVRNQCGKNCISVLCYFCNEVN